MNNIFYIFLGGVFHLHCASSPYKKKDVYVKVNEKIIDAKV